MSMPAQAIIELNIAHCERLLTTEMDEAKRQMVARLLAEERAKLAKLKSGSGRPPGPGSKEK